MEKITYIDECLQNGIVVRWPTGTMPIKVYIAPCRWYASKGNDNYTYKAMAKKAFEDWADASGGAVSFQFVNALYDSQINLDWRRVDRKSLGHCRFSYDSKKRLFSAEVNIGLSDGVVHGDYQNMDEVYHTILHEVGHALGIGHSPFADDIMYVPHKYGVKTLSATDKKTLQWLYKVPAVLTIEDVVKRFCSEPFYSIDEMILFLESDYIPPNLNLEPVNTNYNYENIPERDLQAEQERIANLNLYRMSLQNIQIAPKLKDYITKTNLPEK